MLIPILVPYAAKYFGWYIHNFHGFLKSIFHLVIQENHHAMKGLLDIHELMLEFLRLYLSFIMSQYAPKNLIACHDQQSPIRFHSRTFVFGIKVDPVQRKTCVVFVHGNPNLQEK